METIRAIGAAADIQVGLLGRWRGGDGERLLNRRHSLLADSFAAFVSGRGGWVVEPEVSFSIFGERGFIDQLGWHAATRHLLLVELKTEFADFNEMLGTLDRKTRLARKIAVERGWAPELLSVWLVVTDTRTNRRHAAEHAALLRARFALDGRSLDSFLRNPRVATSGMAFWSDANHSDTKREASRNMTRVRSPKRPQGPGGAVTGSRSEARPGDGARPKPLGH